MQPSRRVVNSPLAPAAVGPYSQAVAAAGLLFCSGQIPLDPDSGEIVKGGATEQAERCLKNLEAVCQAAGVALRDAVRMTVYMTDLADFPALNSVFESYFESDPPARVTVGVSALPKGAVVELEATVPLA